MDTPYVETDCTFQGFESGGAMVAPDYAIAYVAYPWTVRDAHLNREYVGMSVTLTNWHGEPIGTAVVTGKWPNPRGIFSRHNFSYRATIDGRKYNMRGGGAGMVAKGKAAKS